MANRPAKNTQAEIARALRAVKQVGMPMAVELAPDGTIRLVPAEKIEVRMPKQKAPRRPVPL